MNNPVASDSNELNGYGIAGTNYCGPGYANRTACSVTIKPFIQTEAFSALAG